MRRVKHTAVTRAKIYVRFIGILVKFCKLGYCNFQMNSLRYVHIINDDNEVE